EQVGLPESRPTVDEERIPAHAWLAHHCAGRLERHPIALADHEGRESAVRVGSDVPGRSPPGPERRPPHCRLSLECAIDDELQAAGTSCSGVERASERVGVVTSYPLQAECARHLDRELIVLPRHRPHRRDPRVETLCEQASAKLPSRLLPDGLEHPPTPRSSDRHSDSSRCPHAALSTRGENSRNSPCNKPLTPAVASDRHAPPRSLHIRGGTASNP